MLPPAKRENLPLRGKVFTSQIFVLTKGPCRADFIWTYKPTIKRNHSFHLIESGLVNVIIAQTATILHLVIFCSSCKCDIYPYMASARGSWAGAVLPGVWPTGVSVGLQ